MLDKAQNTYYNKDIIKEREIKIMERTYTENELKQWFELTLKAFPNSNFYQQLLNVRDTMFNDERKYSLKNTLDKS